MPTANSSTQPATTGTKYRWWVKRNSNKAIKLFVEMLGLSAAREVGTLPEPMFPTVARGCRAEVMMTMATNETEALDPDYVGLVSEDEIRNCQEMAQRDMARAAFVGASTGGSLNQHWGAAVPLINDATYFVFVALAPENGGGE
jgi:hypothetical protein